MKDDVEVTLHKSAIDRSTVFAVNIQDSLQETTAWAVVKLVAEKVAQRYVDEHFAEIAAKLDQNAIANLAIAEASKKIAEEIERRPTVIHETKNHTEVYQRGLLGGLRRIG